MSNPFEEFNKLPYRIEGKGFIKWYNNKKLICEVSLEEYYRGGHIHPIDCSCDALVHNESFQSKLKEQLEVESE